MVSKAIDVYHSQYENLKHTIIAERGNLVEIYRVLDGELELIGNEEKNFISFHTSFLDRCLRQLEGQLESVMDLFRDALGRFQQHCGAIKRHALERVRVASNALNTSMEESCTGLITGYTGGYAQGYFDELKLRSGLLRTDLTNLHGKLMDEKEKFLREKNLIEKEILDQITDSITVDRSRCRGLLEGLAADTSTIQQALATTRSAYTYYQKDANARMVIKIESAIRECRKLSMILTHSLAYSLTHWLTHSLAYSLTHWLTHSLAYSLTHSLADSLTHSLAYSLIVLLTPSLTHWLTY
jgi:hypothetical protein